MWSRLGVRVDGSYLLRPCRRELLTYYVSVCLPFGLSQAPGAFARLLQCVYRLLQCVYRLLQCMYRLLQCVYRPLPRARGWPVTGMVDECFVEDVAQAVETEREKRERESASATRYGTGLDRAVWIVHYVYPSALVAKCLFLLDNPDTAVKVARCGEDDEG